MAVTPPPVITMAESIPIPTLNILPPSSDTESWSCSPSPRPRRYHSRSRNRENRTAKEVQQRDASENHWDKGKGERDGNQSPSHASSLPPMVSNVEEEEQESPSVLLLPPSRSCSRSSSLSRRSRWSFRSLLSKDSDCDSSRSVCFPLPLAQSAPFPYAGLKKKSASTLDAQRDIPTDAMKQILDREMFLLVRSTIISMIFSIVFVFFFQWCVIYFILFLDLKECLFHFSSVNSICACHLPQEIYLTCSLVVSMKQARNMVTVRHTPCK